MPPFRRSVSSLGSLAAFEAAARHASFTRAAEELGVTQAAVSRQVRRLEDDLGAALFRRGHRRVELTEPGRHLAAVLGEAFGRVAEAVEAIRRPAADAAVALGTTLAFAQFWLVPRLPALRAAHPGLRLRLVSEDADFDLRDGRLDLAVRWGRPPFADAAVLGSMEDEVVPVCAPALARTLPEAPAGGALPPLPVIGLEWAEPSWLTWPDWAAMAGLPAAPVRGELRMNHYADAVQAAVAGEGVVLGWRRLVGPLLADGRLVPVGTARARPPERYHLLAPAGRTPTPAARALAGWLAGQFGPLA